MPHLILNVRNHFAFAIRAHRETTITILPTKLRKQSATLVEVLRRIRFHISHEISDAMCRTQLHQQMHVINPTTDPNRHSLEPSNSST
jgi:hypothetical protein